MSTEITKLRRSGMDTAATEVVSCVNDHSGFWVGELRNGTGRNVTFPAHQYAINGERWSFALLRPTVDPAAQAAVRDAILEAYEAEAAAASQ